jgi:hypothetical protein
LIINLNLDFLLITTINILINYTKYYLHGFDLIIIHNNHHSLIHQFNYFHQNFKNHQSIKLDSINYQEYQHFTSLININDISIIV